MDSYPLSIFYFIKMAKEIQLTQGKVAIVDDEDFEYLNQWKWYANNNNGKFYVRKRFLLSNGKVSKVLMHRFIMKPNKDMVIDHLDGNPLNNQKTNLRICTQSENNKNRNCNINNRSGFKGVYWFERAKKWRTHIRNNKKIIYLGCYINIIDAANAYNAAAIASLAASFCRGVQ